MVLTLLVMMIALFGCSSDNNDSNRPLGSTAKVIGNTTFTDDVVTDGNWLVWEGRQQKLLFNTGKSTVDLGAKLDPKYSLGTDNDDKWRGMKFDGRRLFFAADDVTDSEPPQIFMIDTQNTSYTPVLMSTITASQAVDYTSSSLDNGIFAWVMDDPAVVDQRDVFYYNANATTQAVVQLTDDAAVENSLVVSGNIIAWVNGSDNEIYTADISVTPVVITKLTDSGNPKNALQGKGGLLAWNEGTMVYYSNGTTVNQATADGNEASIYSLTVGNGNIAWVQGGEGFSVVYRRSADAAKAITTAASGLSNSPNDLSVGDGIIAWYTSAWTSPYYTFTGSVFTMGSEPNSQSTFATQPFYYSSSISLNVSDKKIFWGQDLRNTGKDYPERENPSSYLWTYDTAATTPEAVKVSTDDYFRILSNAVGSGKVAWYGHDANRRLYATNANDISTPVAITPAAVNARQPQISNGIVVYKGMDRSEMGATYDGGDQDIYYANLNQSGWPITRVTENFMEEDKPAISGNIITWKTSQDANEDYIYEVNFYNIATKVTHTMTSTSNDSVRTDGRFVIWREYSTNQLFYYDTTATTPVETAVEGATGLSKCPNISKGLLTWIRYDGSAYKIYYLDLNSATASVVEVATADASDQPPQTDGRFIVWGGDQNGSNDYSIKYYDTTAATPVVVDTAADVMNSVCVPRLSNGVVIFAAEDYGATASDGDKEIFTINLKATTPAVVQLTDNDLWDSNPDFSNGVVIWRTGGSSSGDWYGKITAALRL